MVASLGGDGTARSVAEGIAHTDTALACLPAGSRNVFLFAASVGLSARANRQLDRRPRFKARLGALYGAAVALGAGAAYPIRPPGLELRGGGREEVRAVSLIIQNARPLTYVGDRPVELCERVSLTSGTVSIAGTAIRQPGRW